MIVTCSQYARDKQVGHCVSALLLPKNLLKKHLTVEGCSLSLGDHSRGVRLLVTLNVDEHLCLAQILLCIQSVT